MRYLLLFILTISTAYGGLFSSGLVKSGGSGGGGSDISATIYADGTQTRTTGVAPLGVFFNATSSSDTSYTSNPREDLKYTWDFGDSSGSPVSGTTWGYGVNSGSASRNTASGPWAAHVFENVGTFDVTLTVSDGTNTATKHFSVTTTDPDTVFSADTVCFSTSGDFTNCPSGATQVTQSDWHTAINSYNASYKRLLFHAGETFSASSHARLGSDGPGIIGKYDTGADPIWTYSTADQAFLLSGSTTPGIGDWRMMDIEMSGPASSGSHAIEIDGTFNQFTALRLNIHDWARGISGATDILDYWDNNGHTGHTAVEEWFLQDNIDDDIDSGIGDWRIFLSGNNVAVLGNHLDGQNGGSHVIRGACIDGAVIAHNYIAHPGSTQHALKIHAIGWSTDSPVCNPGGTGAYTQNVLIDDNEIVGYNNAWTVSLGPQNAQSDERLRYVVFEKNWMVAGSGQSEAVETSAVSSVFRNNILDLSGATDHHGFDITQRGIEPASSDVRVYNNTIYSSDASNFVGVNIVSAASSITAENNLGYAPSSTSRTMVSDSGSGDTVSNNSSDAQVLTSPNFTSGTPSVPADYVVTSGGYGVDAGATVPVHEDFSGTSRPQNSLFDIGAYER